MAGKRINENVDGSMSESILERVAEQVREVVIKLALVLDPFPLFLGLNTIHAVEVEPSGYGPDRGCVVICSDGQLYRMILRMVPGPVDIGGVEQSEELMELDLSANEYLSYAYNAIRSLIELLEQRTRDD